MTVNTYEGIAMAERRHYRRITVDYWASLTHPLLGTVTCEIQNMSRSGLLLKPNEELPFFVMMELDVRIYGEGWDGTMPSLPVQVVRANQQEIALRFMDIMEDAWFGPDDELEREMESLSLRRIDYDSAYG